MMKEQRWQDWLILAIGGYVIATPWLFPTAFQDLDVTGLFLAAHFAIGIAIIIVAAAALFLPKVWQEVAQIIFGLWLFILPWIIGYQHDLSTTMNDSTIGLLIVLFALLALATRGPTMTNRRL